MIIISIIQHHQNFRILIMTFEIAENIMRFRTKGYIRNWEPAIDAYQFLTILHSTISLVLLQTNFDPKKKEHFCQIFSNLKLQFIFLLISTNSINQHLIIIHLSSGYINFYAWIPPWVFVCFVYAFVKYVHARLVCLVAVFKCPLELGFNLTTPQRCWGM